MNRNKRARSSVAVDQPLVDVWLRQLGHLSTRNFALRRAASQDLVLRLDVYKKLDKHRGCVNTVSFNPDGDILVSGSDDRRVILWDWQTGNVKLLFHSGHGNNVFQAKIMPYTDDRSIVTCAADGQVRHAQILERGRVETKLLAKHQGRAHKLAVEPGSSHIFYTCGEDGLVQHFDLRTGAATELFTCRPIDDRRSMLAVNLNAIAIDPRNPNLFAVAGSDEYTRLYDIRKYKWDGSTDFGQPADYFCPPNLIGDEQVGITGLAFSDQSELLVSYNEEFIYLFTQDMGLGPNPMPSSPLSTGSDANEMVTSNPAAASPSIMDAEANLVPQVYKGHQNSMTVKGVGFFGPKCEYVVSGSDCGRIFIWKKKGGELIRVMEADKEVVNCIESHPHETVLASSGIEKDIKIWTPNAKERATLPTNIEQVLIPDRILWFTLGDEDDEGYFYDENDDDDDDDDDDDVDDDDDDDDGDDDVDDNADGDFDSNANNDYGQGFDSDDDSVYGGGLEIDVDDIDDGYDDNDVGNNEVDDGNNDVDNFVDDVNNDDL
ncbi:hypothetical protein QYF36_022956 [Acer negundo]|nr:hypothetical protein QYF36_022956 [Acer negundo]